MREEGKTIEGLPAIKAWRIETRRKYSHTVEPLAMSERDGKIIVTGKVSVTLDHTFEIEAGKIVRLEIR